MSVLPGWLRETAEGCTLAVRVQPGAKRTGVAGVYGEGEGAQLKVALQAPPVEGRANEALIAFLALALSVARSRIAIVHGEQDRRKVLVLAGMKAAEAAAILRPKL